MSIAATPCFPDRTAFVSEGQRVTRLAALKGSLPSARHYFGIGAAHPALISFSELSAAGSDPPDTAADADAGFVKAWRLDERERAQLSIFARS